PGTPATLRLRAGRRHLDPRHLPCPATGRGLPPAGRSSRRDPPPLLQCAGERTQRAASRRAWHQRAAGGGLRMNLAATALAWLAFAVLFTPGPLLAQDAPVIYRCTGADGAVTIQNDTPCPAGSKQEIRRIQALPSTPPPAATQAAPAEAVFVPPPLADFV